MFQAISLTLEMEIKAWPSRSSQSSVGKRYINIIYAKRTTIGGKGQRNPILWLMSIGKEDLAFFCEELIRQWFSKCGWRITVI